MKMNLFFEEMLFLQELEKLNDVMIEANINMMNHNGVDQEDHKKALLENIGLIYNQVVEIIKCFDKNKPRLAKYTQDYETLINSWNIFTQETSPKLLGIKLQEVKDNTVNLIYKIKLNNSK